MTDAPAPTRRTRDKLGFQLAFILAVVLLPLTFITVAKSVAVNREARARSEAALLGETVGAASSELRLIQQARGTAAALAGTIEHLLGDNASCAREMAGIVKENPQYSLLAYIPKSGLMRCSSKGVPYDFSHEPQFQEVMSQHAPALVVNRHGPVSGTSVLGISHPVFDRSGTFLGIISVSLPHRTLEVVESSAKKSTETIDLYTFDHTGTILTASTGLDDLSSLPKDRALAALAGEEPLSFTALSEDGHERVYSVVPLVSGEIYALGSRLLRQGALISVGPYAAPILMPALMWLASLIVAWLAVERLVTRNVRKLSRSITSFAKGNRVVGDIDVRSAPLEIREMADAYDGMTQSIVRDEAELENALHHKNLLLHELHHRVKNNLQLIASIMNMQVRRIQSAEARQILVEIRDRVMSLATIHRELFETAGGAVVHSDELLTSIVRQVTEAGMRPGRRFDVTTQFDNIHLVPDQAVPLGLLVAEALTGAMKHGGDDGAKGPRIHVSFRRKDDSRAEVKVVNSTGPRGASALRTGLGTQLIGAFAMQLGGQVEREPGVDDYRLSLVFDLRPPGQTDQPGNGQQVA